MTTNTTPARTLLQGEGADYELYHYRTGSEIRAVYYAAEVYRPEEIVAEFPSIHEAEVAWEQIMNAIGLGL